MQVAITYSFATPEDVESGDASEHGWILEYEDNASLREAIEIFLQNSDTGEVMASCYPMCNNNHCWFTTTANQDGGTAEFSLHIKGITPASLKRLARNVFKMTRI